MLRARYRGTGQDEEALTDLNKALELDPHNVFALLLRSHFILSRTI